LSPSKHKAQRTCLGCRQVLDKDCLVRYVLSPQGEIVVDYRGKLPGRGAYTCIDRGCVLAAAKHRQFDRAFRRANLKPSGEELVEALAAQIRQRILNLLGMARKSGNAVSGSNLVLTALNAPEHLALILLAEDVAGIGDKVLGKAEANGVPCFRLLNKGTLGQLMGKGQRSVVALKSCPLAESLRIELLRYKRIVEES
jgi:uncharacterized protein